MHLQLDAFHYLPIYLISDGWLVGWSLTSLFSTNTAISETNLISDNIMLVDTILYKSLAVAEMGDRATAKWAEKWGGCYASFRGGAGSHLTQCRLGQGLPL